MGQPLALRAPSTEANGRASARPAPAVDLFEELEPAPASQRMILIVAVILPFVAVLAAIVQLWNRWVTAQDLVLFATMYFSTALGVTVGYHRMLTHSSFQTHPAVRFTLLALGSMAVQGGALHWASVHIQHHAMSDREDDPHSPLRGLFHAHLGWMLDGFRSRPAVYGRHLMADPMVMFFERTFMAWIAFAGVLCYLIGGWQGLLWGFGVRVFFTQHVTWSVNSICHTFGKRTFATTDLSRNNWIVGLLAMGEGWHNNHHAFPRSANHGLRWYEPDVSAWFIALLERLGLAWDVKRPTEAQIQAKLAKAAGSPGAA
jgi:stearoyl-CoA desaturase (delta-9 desaturase)